MSDRPSTSRQRLIALLQLAYSGELAAGFAYRGHARSVRDQEERARIKLIEDEEWHHRRQVGEMLAQLGAAPARWREVRAWCIGRVLATGCHLAGWFAPMYGAGRLESGNVREYETAARLARDCGRPEFCECLLVMAEVEWEHERYFREKVAGHRGLRWLRPWTVPPSKETIRASFERDRAAHEPHRTVAEVH